MKTLLAILLFVPALAWSQANDSQPAEPGSDKLDRKKLEDKYWSAKDTDFSVVQNRTYTKAKRFFVTGSYGTLLNDAYSTGRLANLAAGYYFNERWGVEFSQEKAYTSDNASVTFMQDRYGIKPDYNRFVQYQSVNVLFVPFYAKMSALDRAIVYFDIQFALGLGGMTYSQQTDPRQNSNFEKTANMSYNFDFSQQLFFSKHFAFRLDLKNKWSKQEVNYWQLNSTSGYSESNRTLKTNTQQDTTLLFGLTFFF